MLNVIVVLVTLANLNATEPPSDAAVLRALPPVARGIPLVYEEFRDDITITKNRISSAKAGPQVFIPLVGPRHLVTTNWECEVFYNERIQVDFPFPFQVTKKRVQVVYMEKAELAK